MMQVKRYVAPSYAEALILAKNELGTDALIVDSKKVRLGGFLGFFQKTMTELTVAVDKPANPAGAVPPPPGVAAPAPVTISAPAGASGVKPAPAAGAAPIATVAPAPAEAVSAPASASGAAVGTLEREIVALRSVVSRLLEQEENRAALDRLTPYGRQVYTTLVERGVDRSAALDLGLKLPDGPSGQALFQAEMSRLLSPFQPTSLDPGHRSVVALVGPTGAGKTTTLAKLAAHFALDREQKVGLITADTFRIAAIEQLRTFGDILGIPLHAVETPADMVLALQSTADCSVVLVDTGGRNHRDSVRMQELREMLAVLHPDETHLVVSLTANPRDAFEWLDYYGPLGVNRLLFTKLDEASSPGLMLNMRLRCSHPLGYVTNGQSVPEDIIPADRADFAHIFLGASSPC